MRALFVVGAMLLAQPAFAQSNEKYTGSNVDVRTILSFKASDAAVQKMLPEGWEVNSPAAGPSKGANLGLTLIDQVTVQDAEGKPATTFRGAVFTIPAKKKGTDTAGTMVFTGLMSAGGRAGRLWRLRTGEGEGGTRGRDRSRRQVDRRGKVGIQGGRRQLDRGQDRVRARPGPAKQGRGQGLFGGEAGILPHLALRAGTRCGAQHGERGRSGGEDFREGYRREARSAVRRRAAIDQRDLDPLVFPTGLPAGFMMLMTGSLPGRRPGRGGSSQAALTGATLRSG